MFNVFKVLLSKGIITQDLVNMLLSLLVRGSTSFVGQGFNPEMGRPWKT
jgi:hypothetical protein